MFEIVRTSRYPPVRSVISEWVPLVNFLRRALPVGEPTLTEEEAAQADWEGPRPPGAHEAILVRWLVDQSETEGSLVPDQYALLAVLSALWRESLLRAARRRGLLDGPRYVGKDRLVALLLKFPRLTLSPEFLEEFEPTELSAACRKLRLAPDGEDKDALVNALLGAEHRGGRRHVRRWRPYLKARAYVRRLGLLDLSDWQAYARGELAEHKGKIPGDIPKVPWTVYRGEGWQGVRDFIGTDGGEPAERGYLTFKASRRLARRLRLRNRRGWEAWCSGELPDRGQRPENVPADPERIYAKAWRGWKDWLGQKRGRRHRFRPFVDARAFSRSLGLKSTAEWRSWSRGARPDLPPRPEDIPACPNVTYHALGWQGFGDWLGTGNKAKRNRPRMPFEEARRLARSLRFNSVNDWTKWWRSRRRGESSGCLDLPSHPDRAYRDEGWIDWADFLGTKHRKGCFREFKEARRFARGLGLASGADWFAFCRGEFEGLERPIDIPVSPAYVYRNRGWISFRDWLGTTTQKPGA
jgi:hypothetical protein